jgi:hypothetical protein
MTRRVKRSDTKRSTKRSKRSMKRSKRSLKHNTKRSRGGAQGAPLEQAFSGVVLPSDVYRPILKPMNGGDGYAYQASLPAAPMVPMKGRRGKKRSVRRRGKARMPVGHALPVGYALPVGHALPPGFGQTVQSFRPL